MNYLGIDLGTTFTKAAVYNTDSGVCTRIVLEPDCFYDEDKYCMPTVVYVRESAESKREYRVGRRVSNLKFMDTKRGCYFERFKPALDYEDAFASRSPEISYLELVKCILLQVKERAYAQIKAVAEKVVLTVPASSVKNGRRWKLMKQAGREIFNADVDILHEPEAAGYALLRNKVSDVALNGKKFLIYDFGGGTFDATVFKIEDEQLFIMGESVGSDAGLKWGGIYIDSEIGKDLVRNSRVVGELVSKIRNGNASDIELRIYDEIRRKETVKAKKLLSESNSYLFSDYELTRKHFELLIRQMIDETVQSCRRLVDSIQIDNKEISLCDIDSVFLVGGSSRIPLVSKIWQETASAKLVSSELPVVSEGAALFHAMKVKPERLVEIGMNKFFNKEYSKAAMCFFNAGNEVGYYYLGSMYYKGCFTPIPLYSEAKKYYELSQSEHASLMLALMYFCGYGVRRNQDHALLLLGRASDGTLAKTIKAAIKGDIVDFDLIYDYDPFSVYIAEKDNKLSSIDERVAVPARDSELDYNSLLMKIRKEINNRFRFIKIK